MAFGRAHDGRLQWPIRHSLGPARTNEPIERPHVSKATTELRLGEIHGMGVPFATEHMSQHWLGSAPLGS